MASFYKYRDVWRAEIQFKGHRESKSGFRIKADAQKWVDERMVYLRGTTPQAYKEGVETFKDLLERYEAVVTSKKKGIREETLRLRRFANDKVLGKLKLDEITPAALSKWRDNRLKEVSSGSVRREWGTISNLLKIAHFEWQVIPEINTAKFAKPKDNPPRTHLITNEEVTLLRLGFDFDRTDVSQIKHRVFIAFMVSLLTGLRAKEVLDIRRMDISKEHILKVRDGKTGGREVYLVAAARALLYELDQTVMFDLNASQLDSNFRKYRDQVGLQHIRFHDARSAFATFQSSKLTPARLAKVMGASIATIMKHYYREKTVDFGHLME